MRKIFTIASSVLAAALLLASCQKEEQPRYQAENHITVVKSNVIFDATGGTGTIELKADGTVTMDCTSDWCTANLSGTTVTVTAQQNRGLDGRSAIISLTCNGQTTKVTAQQTGMAFTYADQTIVIPMAGEEFMIYGRSTLPKTVEASDWIKYSGADNGYLISVGENITGDNRSGYFKISAGDITATYTITQKFDRNFAGTYTMSYGTASGTVSITRDASNEDLYYLEDWLDGIKVPIHYDGGKNMLYIVNGQYLAQYTDGNYMYICVNYTTLDGGTMYYAISTSVNYYVWFNFEYVNGKYNITLADSAKWFNTSRTSCGFGIYTFTTDPSVALATANKKSTLLSVKYPSFVQQ